MKLLQGTQPFVPLYKRGFGGIDGPLKSSITEITSLLTHLEAQGDGIELLCSTSHQTVVFSLTDGKFVCWFTYGLTFIDGKGRCGDVSAYFIQDFEKVVHRAETIVEATQVIVALLECCAA